jgi:CBS domain-containing protein
MESELQDILNFFKQTVAIRKLPESALKELVAETRIVYVRKGDLVKGINEAVFIVRKGLLNHLDENDQLIDKFDEGDTFNLMKRDVILHQLRAEEDSLIYEIDHTSFDGLIEKDHQLQPLIRQNFEQRVSQKVSELDDQSLISATLSNRLVEDCYHEPLYSIESGTTVQEAARLMSEKRISSIVVMADDELKGILTDKDLRRRFVAEGLPFDTMVDEIMTTKLSTIDINATAFDAMMMMTSRHIHHIPVTRNNQVIGMVTATDLMNNEGNNTVNLTSLIHKSNTIEELATACKLLPRLQIRMTKLGTRASNVTKSISAITKALTFRLAVLAEQKLGPSPVPFAWVGLGSQARQEQLIHTDQDNAMIISDEMTDADAPWFKAFAQFINDGLNECGFVYCPGDVMASNDKWRQTQSVWHNYFNNWVNKPEPLALMHTSIFFDMETVYGDNSLVEPIRERMLNNCKGNTIFLAHMTKNALSNRPPLGLIRDFVLISEGEHKSKLDIKHNGLAPVVDLARIYALSEGISAVNTFDRLNAAMDTPAISTSSARSLLDAMELLMQIRLEHQSNKLERGEAADNYLSLSEMSRLERQHLKDAFKVIKTLQDSRQSVF